LGEKIHQIFDNSKLKKILSGLGQISKGREGEKKKKKKKEPHQILLSDPKQLATP
jgi:hypothetical protein